MDEETCMDPVLFKNMWAEMGDARERSREREDAYEAWDRREWEYSA